MKKFRLNELRSSLLKTQAWSIHEPALSALMELIGSESALSAKQINERLGLSRSVTARVVGASSDNGESTAQMVGNIAVLPIFGVLQQRASWMTKYLGWTATEQLERDFRAALANDQVKAIVLYCDSPGGVAVGIDEVSSVIFAGRKSKPIQAFVRGYCASAAYYLASAAMKLTATPSSTVGSVGTIYTHVEYADYLKAQGIGVNIIKHGARKGDGNPYEKLSTEAKASLQRWVDAYGDQFDAAVARNRGITVSDVRNTYGQGEAFLAAASQARGMIDAIGTWEQLLAGLKTPGVPLPQPNQTLASQVPVRGQQLSQAFAAGEGTLVAGWTPAMESAYAAPLDLSVLNASGNTAAANAAQSTSPEQSNVKVSLKVRAALFARGLIAAQDCDDALCLVAIGAFYAARGEACPQANNQLDDDKVIAALFAIASGGASAHGQNGQAAPAATPAAAAQAPAAAGNVAAAHTSEMQEAARQTAEANALTRVKEISASGKLLGMSQEQIEAAIAGGKPLAEVAADFLREKVKQEKPVGQAHTPVTVVQEGIDRYCQDALLASLLHVGQTVEQKLITPAVEQLSAAPLWVHAEACLKSAGVRYDAYDREDIAQKALAMDGYEHIRIRADSSIAYNRPGNFPNLLSNIAGKILDMGVEAAETTYQDYVGVWPGDLPDFKPAPVVAKGAYGEFDEVLDAKEFEEQKLDEEMLSYMLLRRFGNAVAFTPVLLANDDLAAFTEDLLGLGEGWEMTKNRGCLGLVTGNVSLLDGVALYDDATHGNLITAGGAAPSVTTWDAMQQKMAGQKTIGSKGYARTRLRVVLVPPKHQVAAEQTFLPLGGTVVVENKQAATDTNLNVFRGKVRVSVEPDLQLSSNDVWYGFADPARFRNATIVIAYFRGWGRAGKRERWYDPKTKCYYVSLEGRAGFAAKNYRTTVRNPGT